MSYIKQNLENYSSMIKSEVGYASTNDYFSRKTRFDRQEFAETTEIIGMVIYILKNLRCTIMKTFMLHILYQRQENILYLFPFSNMLCV